MLATENVLQLKGLIKAMYCWKSLSDRAIGHVVFAPPPTLEKVQESTRKTWR